MRKTIRSLAAGSFGLSTAALVGIYSVAEQKPSEGWPIGLEAALGISAVTWIILSDKVVSRMRRGPELAIRTVTPEERVTPDGRKLQVLVASIYNRRDAGDDPATAWDTVPKLEAIGPSSEVFEDTPGVWLRDAAGNQPTTISFRPTHEPYGLELVAKFQSDENAFLAGQRDANLPPGRIRIRASLRGRNLRKPAVFDWLVTNPGEGAWLTFEEIRTRRFTKPPETMFFPRSDVRDEKVEAPPKEDTTAIPQVQREMSSPEVLDAKLREHAALRATEDQRSGEAREARGDSELEDEDDLPTPPPKPPAYTIVMADRAELHLNVAFDPFTPTPPVSCEVTTPSGQRYETQVQPRTRPYHPLVGAISVLGPKEAVAHYPIEFAHAPQKLQKGVYKVRWIVKATILQLPETYHDSFRIES